MALSKTTRVTPPDLTSWPNFHVDIETIITDDGVEVARYKERTSAKIIKDGSWAFSEPDPKDKVPAEAREAIGGVVNATFVRYGA